MESTKPKTASLIGGLILLLTGGGCATWAFVFILLGVIYVVVFPIAFGMPFDDLRLDRGDPLRGSGEVVSLELVPSTSINGQSVYTLEYDFDAGGEPVHDDARVLGDHALAQAEPGDPLEIEYLGDDPSVSRPVGASANPGGWAGIVGFPFLLLGLLSVLPVALMLGFGIKLVVGALRTR